MAFDEVRRIAPTRVVFDSLSEIRLLAQSPLRYPPGREKATTPLSIGSERLGFATQLRWLQSAFLF
jgi:hypothetical protein